MTGKRQIEFGLGLGSQGHYRLSQMRAESDSEEDVEQMGQKLGRGKKCEMMLVQDFGEGQEQCVSAEMQGMGGPGMLWYGAVRWKPTAQGLDG